MGAVTEPPQQRTLQLTHDATHQAAQHSPDNGAIDPVIAAREPHILRWTRTDTWVFSIIAIATLVSRFVLITFATSGGTPVFDEKHYVPQAWDMVRSTTNPMIGGIESNPGFGLVVHPPLGKQLLALGEFVFGYSPLGWRIITALFGTATVLSIMGLARRVSHSTAVAAFAGTLALFDGVLLTASRFGMLDIFQAFFIVAAAYALARDHEQMNLRLHRAYVSGLCSVGELGPRFGFRWWRFICGIMLGSSLSVKWSGLYYIVFFGLLSVGLDMWLRHRYRIRRPILGSLAYDAFPAFASLVIVPVLLYVWSWRAWFAHETSIYRHSASNGDIDPNSPLMLLPDSLAGWLHYHQTVLEFHSSLTSSNGHSHPWDSKPWSWLVAARPVLYYSSSNEHCFLSDGPCRSMIYLFGTPAIWWLTVPVVLWALWCLVVRRAMYVLIPLVAWAAGFLPWLATFDRQMYFFYAVPLVPFTIVLIALTLGQLGSTGQPLNQLRANRVTGLAQRLFGATTRTGALWVIAYLALVATMFFYFSPVLYGMEIPDSTYFELMWLRSWR